MRKVAYAQFCYINQEGSIRLQKPTFVTVRNEGLVEDRYARYHPDYPEETLEERAKRLDIIDVWKPFLRMQFANTHCLEYTGKKALQLWEAWNAYIFGKINKTTKQKKDKGITK